MNSHTIQGATWYTTAAYYPTRAQARAAWARANDLLRDDSSLDIGLTSLSPGGTASFGEAVPRGVFPVVGITRNELAARKVERKLREATRFRPSEESAAGLAARHVRLSVAHHGPTVIRRPEGRGERVADPVPSASR
jgi:hypothetical protein